MITLCSFSIAASKFLSLWKSRIELRNLQILKKMQEKLSHQSSFVSRKAWMLPWILQELEEYAQKMCGYGQHWRPFDSSFEWKEY